MSIKISIHRTYRQFTNGLEMIEVRGAKVGECLENLVKKYPDLKPRIFTHQGALPNVVEIFLNDESAYPDELNKPVKDGDTIYITLNLSGG